MESSYLVSERDLDDLRAMAQRALGGGKGCAELAREVVRFADSAERGEPHP